MAARIMVVEDDAEIRRGLIIRLQSQRYEVTSASEVSVAVSTMLRERPDLILLDLGLPGGDGYLVMARLRAAGYTAPILVLSARDPELNRERAVQAGAAEFLEKPVDNAELLGAIARCLETGFAVACAE